MTSPNDELIELLAELDEWFRKPPIKHDQGLPERFAAILAHLRSDGPDGIRCVPVELTDQAVERAAKVIAASPLIDSPKLSYQAWMGLARTMLRTAGGDDADEREIK